MLMIDRPAPQFVASAVTGSGDIEEIALKDYAGKWVILFFYPADFSLVCPTELTHLRDLLPQFTDANTVILGCSVDSVHAHKRWIRDDLGNLGYPLLSDITKRISRDYHALLEEKGMSTRATFIINPEQIIQHYQINSSKIGRNIEEIYRLLLAIQSGQLCQSGWKKGDSHINPLR